jgi:hemerythrin-like domain-containing protein
MKLTAALSEDHRVIEQVLKCLLEMASKTAAGAPLDVSSADAAVRFFRTFADQCHHKKEEDVLFPALGRAGFSPEAGPVAVMLEEHEVGRKYVARIDAAIEQARANAPTAGAAFVSAARAYADLLSNHIAKEDHILFPLADHAITGAAADMVMAGFQNAENALEHGRLHVEMLGVADALGRKFGVGREGAPGAFSGCCHHGPAAHAAPTAAAREE